MAEYIERGAVNALIKAECSPKVAAFLNHAIDNIPAADVRPVVTCSDCKWYQIDELKKDGTADRRYKPSVCVLAKQRRDPNHFCADGKKREES